jgi:hypothetical protein
MPELMSTEPVDVSKLPDFVDVVCMRPVEWGPSPKLVKRYLEGERLTIPKSRFSDWNKQENHDGFRTRGSFVLYSEWIKGQAVDNVPKRGDDIAFLLAENEALKRQLAQGPEASREPLVVADKGGKRSKKEEI